MSSHPLDHSPGSRGVPTAPQIVVQLMFVEELGEVVQIDAVALGVPTEEGVVPGGTLVVQCIPPRDPMFGPMLVNLLKRWADASEVVRMSVLLKPHPIVVIDGARSRMQLDLVDSS